MSVPKCRLCGEDIHQAAERGAFFRPIRGEHVEWECRPSCESTGNNEDAILRALDAPSDREVL